MLFLFGGIKVHGSIIVRNTFDNSDRCVWIFFKKIDDNTDAISNIEKTYVKREDYEKDKKDTENHFREIEQNYITKEECTRGIGQIQKTLEIMEEHSRDSHKTLHEKIDRLIERNVKNG